MKDNSSLAHTTYNCKYHVVFAPKYRRKAIYGKLRVDIGKILRMLCERKGIRIIDFKDLQIKVNLSGSLKSYYEQVEEKVNKIDSDLKAISNIETDENTKLDILYEYNDVLKKKKHSIEQQLRHDEDFVYLNAA